MPFIAGAMIVGAGASYFGGRSAQKSAEKLQKMQLWLQHKQLKFAKQRWNHYRDTYGDLEKVMVADALEGVKGDFAGEASRARQDVLAAGEAQQESQRRELMSLGLDPGSGRYQSTDRRLGLEMTGRAAMAGNNARANERARVESETFARRAGVGQFGAQMMQGAGRDVMQSYGAMGQAYGQQGDTQQALAGNLFAQAGQMGMYGVMQGADSGLWGRAVEGVKGFFDRGSTNPGAIEFGVNNAGATPTNSGFDTTFSPAMTEGDLWAGQAGPTYAGVNY